MKARELAEKILALPTDQQDLPISYNDEGHDLEITSIAVTSAKLNSSPWEDTPFIPVISVDHD